MSLATLSDVLQPALKGGYAVGGLVTLGWEEMRAYVAAACACSSPSCSSEGSLRTPCASGRHSASKPTVEATTAQKEKDSRVVNMPSPFSPEQANVSATRLIPSPEQ